MSASRDLAGALNQRLDLAPVVTTKLLRQNGKPVVDAEVGFDVRKNGAPGFGTADLGVAGPDTDSAGTTAMALPADSYQQILYFEDTSTTPPYLAAEGTEIPLALSKDTTRTFQTDQYTFKIQSPQADIQAFSLIVFQTDASGNVNFGTGHSVIYPFQNGGVYTDTPYPVVFSSGFTLNTPGPATTVDLELFPGSYRAVVFATPKSETDRLAASISPVFTVKGGGLTVSQDIVLSKTERVLTVKLLDENGNPLTENGPYTLRFSDPINWPYEGFLGEVAADATTATGSVMVDKTLSKVAVSIYDASTQPKLVGTYVFDGTTSQVTLKLVKVSGYIKATAGAIASTEMPVVGAVTKTGLGHFYDGAAVASTSSSSSPWPYEMRLLGSPTGISYVLSVGGIAAFPDSQALTVTVKDQALVDQNITVSPGGVIMGKLQDEAHNDLENVQVDVWQSLDDGSVLYVNGTKSSIDGDYSVPVPFGKYFLVVGGAVTPDVVVSASAPQYRKNLTRYSLMGRITKAMGSSSASAVNATIFSSAGVISTKDLGAYTVDVFEGQNWFCVQPGSDDRTYGYTCQLNVMVDDASVAAANLK